MSGMGRKQTFDTLVCDGFFRQMQFRQNKAKSQFIVSACAALATSGCDTAVPSSSNPDRTERRNGREVTKKIQPMVMNEWQSKPAGCSLMVYFGSVGAGIDDVARRRIEELLEQDAAVVTVQPYLRGREGETLLCIRVNNDTAIERLFGELRALVPKNSGGRPIILETKDGVQLRNH